MNVFLYVCVCDSIQIENDATAPLFQFVERYSGTTYAHTFSN